MVEQTPKTKSANRLIPLSDEAVRALQELKEMNKYKNSDYVFSTQNNTIIVPRNLQHTLDRILKAANLQHYGLHSLRHSFASRLFAKGVEVKTVSKLLGHSSVATTYSCYIHVIQEQEIAAIKLLDN